MGRFGLQIRFKCRDESVRNKAGLAEFGTEQTTQMWLQNLCSNQLYQTEQGVGHAQHEEWIWEDCTSLLGESLGQAPATAPAPQPRQWLQQEARCNNKESKTHIINALQVPRTARSLD